MDWQFMPRAKPHQCRLLELPAEIRESIFEYATTSERSLVAFCLDEWQRYDHEEAIQPSITRTCRQIRNESLPLFYRYNNIVLHTDGSKYHETSAWLRCVARHLPKMYRFSIWVRFVTPTHPRSYAGGAICLRLRRSKPLADLQVQDTWKWVTKTRPSPSVKLDGELLVRMLKAMVADGRSYLETADSLSAALADLREEYVKEKWS